MRTPRQDRLGDLFSYVFLAVTFLFFAWPLLWLLSLALSDAKGGVSGRQPVHSEGPDAG